MRRKPFERVVREICADKELVVRWQKSALECLQEVTEMFRVRSFVGTYKCYGAIKFAVSNIFSIETQVFCNHRKARTINRDDYQLARRTFMDQMQLSLSIAARKQ